MPHESRDIRCLLTYNAPKAIALRGTNEQAAMAGWLFHELDKPVSAALVQQNQDASGHEYKMSESNDPDVVVRVYYLTDIAAVERFQQIVKSIRTSTSIRRAFTYTAPRSADRLIKEHDKP